MQNCCIWTYICIALYCFTVCEKNAKNLQCKCDILIYNTVALSPGSTDVNANLLSNYEIYLFIIDFFEVQQTNRTML